MSHDELKRLKTGDEEEDEWIENAAKWFDKNGTCNRKLFFCDVSSQIAHTATEFKKINDALVQDAVTELNGAAKDAVTESKGAAKDAATDLKGIKIKLPDSVSSPRTL